MSSAAPGSNDRDSDRGRDSSSDSDRGSRHKYIIGNNNRGGGWAGRKVLAAASSCTLDDALLLFLITYRQCAPATLSHKSICQIHRYTGKTCMRLHALHAASVFVVRARLLIALAFKLDTSTVLHMTSLSERWCWHLRLSEGHFAIHYSALVSELFVLCAHSPIVSARVPATGEGGREVSTALYIRFSIYYLA